MDHSQKLVPLKVTFGSGTRAGGRRASMVGEVVPSLVFLERQYGSVKGVTDQNRVGAAQRGRSRSKSGGGGAELGRGSRIERRSGRATHKWLDRGALELGTHKRSDQERRCRQARAVWDTLDEWQGNRIRHRHHGQAGTNRALAAQAG
jgi:hypothetical protein